MSVLAFRVKRAFRLSTPQIMRLRSSGTSRGCCWSTATGRTRGMETCESNVIAHIRLSHLSPLQDRQLLLQEHRLYRCTLVVPNLLWLEFTIVRLQAGPSSCADICPQRFRVYLPPLVELLLDDRAGHRHWFVRPYRWYVVFALSS